MSGGMNIHNEAMKWIAVSRPPQVRRVIAAVTNPDPMFRDLSKVETYLKSQIRKYS